MTRAPRPRPSVALENLAGHFRVANLAAGKSERTVQWYDQRIGLFLGFLTEQGMSTDLTDVGLTEARAFVLSLHGPRLKYLNNPFTAPREATLSPHYIRSTVLALRAFFHWIETEGYWPEHKLVRLAVPRAPKEVAPILTKEEIRRVLASFNPNTAYGARDLGLFALLFDKGLRASEVVELKDANVNLEDGWIKVLGKGGKERVIYLGPKAMRAMMHYRDHIRPEPASLRDERFFLTFDGRSMTYNGLKTICQRAARRADVPRLTLHLARHTFATWFLADGGNPLMLQRMLGHSTLTMTNYYVSLSESLLEAAQRRCASPLDDVPLPVPRRDVRRSAVRRGNSAVRLVR